MGLDVSPFHNALFGEQAPEIIPPAKQTGEALSSKLESLTHQALEVFEQHMGLDIAEIESNGNLVRARMQSAVQVTNMQMRVEETKFKQQAREDVIVRILETIAEQKRLLGRE